MSLDLIFGLLFILGLITGFIGTNTGGSALVTIPIMIWLGIPSQSAIASARVASMGTMIAGLRQFHKQKKVDYETALPASILSIIGACIGAYFMISLPEQLVAKTVGIITLILLLFSIIRNKITIDTFNTISSSKKYIGYFLFLITGALGGFYGGQAILATYILIIFFNKTISESVGTRKVNGLAASIAAICIYGLHGIINWIFSLSLITGTLIGSTIGSHYALKKGDKWLEKLFIIVILLLSIKMIFMT